MKKFVIMCIVAFYIITLSACSRIDHSKSSIVQMTVIDKYLNETYIDNCDEKFNLKLEYGTSLYIIKNKDLFNNVKIGESIDVLYITNYDNKDNIFDVRVNVINK